MTKRLDSAHPHAAATPGCGCFTKPFCEYNSMARAEDFALQLVSGCFGIGSSESVAFSVWMHDVWLGLPPIEPLPPEAFTGPRADGG